MLNTPNGVNLITKRVIFMITSRMALTTSTSRTLDFSPTRVTKNPASIAKKIMESIWASDIDLMMLVGTMLMSVCPKLSFPTEISSSGT